LIMKPGARSVFSRILPIIILSVSACVFFFDCRPGADPSPPRRNIFVFRRGRLEQAIGTDFAQNAALLPWPIQTRITDMYATGGTLFCLVNNYGLAALRFEAAGPDERITAPAAGGAPDDAAGADDRTVRPAAGGAPGSTIRPDFSYYYDLDLFGGRSSAGLYARGDSLFCHVYRDEAAAAGNAQAVTFIRFSMNGQGDNLGPSGVVAPGRQQRDPAWQAVVVNPLDDDAFAVEWKRKTADRVYFHYTSYTLSTGEETEHTREWFMHTFSFADALGRDTPARCAALFKACIRELTAAGGECLLHFTVTDARAHTSERYAYQTIGYEQSDDGRYIAVAVSRHEGLLAALLPGARVLLLAENDKAVRTLKLPRLPAGCRYTGLILFQGFICASWEDIHFTHVGAAGLALVPLSDQ
jgi:hypothetical protein